MYHVMGRGEDILRSSATCMEVSQPLSFQNKQTKYETKKQQLSLKARKDFLAKLPQTEHV